MQKTAVQLGAAGLAVLPYALLTGGFRFGPLTGAQIALLITAGAVHTGAAYLLYFAAIPRMSAQTAAVFSYIDPLTAILLSAFLLREPTDAFTWAGAALILGSTLFSGLERKTNTGTVTANREKNEIR